MLNNLGEGINNIKAKNPLIHHITNIVTVNDCANVTLAVGASPVMAVEPLEVSDMVRVANALVINFGTIHESMFEAMMLAGKSANTHAIPIIVDPVGNGATPYRTKKIKQFLSEVQVSVIRGNVSEIEQLYFENSQTRGVDAADSTVNRSDLAFNVANKYRSVVSISGETDIVSNGTDVVRLTNGDALLTKITGTGCMTTSLIACFVASNTNHFEAAITGTALMGIAGERAKRTLHEKGSGSFRILLMDEINSMTKEILNKEVRAYDSTMV